MPKSVDKGYRVLAAKYLRQQAKRLARQLDGVRKSEDTECVHQARVASRRLRAGMQMFRGCFPRKRLKKWRKQIRLVRADLGDARDKDVQIHFLCTTLGNLKQSGCYPGIARLLVELEQQRERLQPKVVKAVNRLAASGVLGEMRTVAKRTTSQGRKARVQSPAAFGRTEKHILENLHDLLPYQDSLDDPEDRRRHHAMRIAAKRLRYTLEISKPVYPGQLDGSIDAIKRVQTLLGDVHDCDVWVDHLVTFSKRQRKRIVKRFGHAGPFARLHVGIEYLRQERQRRRQQLFEELVAYWQQLSRQGHWEELVATVRAGGKRRAEPRQDVEAASDVALRTEAARTRGDGRRLREDPAGAGPSRTEPGGECRLGKTPPEGVPDEVLDR